MSTRCNRKPSGSCDGTKQMISSFLKSSNVSSGVERAAEMENKNAHRTNNALRFTPSPCLSGKQSRAGHALQFVNIRRLLRSCPNAVLEYAFLECAEKFPRNRELCLLRRVEPAVCRAPLFHDGNGFLAGQTNGEGQRAAVTPRLVNWQRLHEPEHARVLQIRKLSAPKFSVAARAPRHHLSATASRYSSARRHFLLYVSFSLLHA